MEDSLEKDGKNILLDEIRKEVLTNAIYYVDTNYHDIIKRSKTEEEQEKSKKKTEELTRIQNELYTIEKEIDKTEKEIEHLKTKTRTEIVEGTIDLNTLLEKISEKKNDLHSQASSSSIAPESHPILYKANFTNTTIPSITSDKIAVLDRIINCLHKTDE